jgi:hypothetical protein
MMASMTHQRLLLQNARSHVLPGRTNGQNVTYNAAMSADPDSYTAQQNVIRLGGETAVVVPIGEYRLLKALEERATPEEIEEAEFDAAIAEHEVWKAAGRPGVKSHEEFMAEILGGAQ